VTSTPHRNPAGGWRLLAAAAVLGVWTFAAPAAALAQDPPTPAVHEQPVGGQTAEGAGPAQPAQPHDAEHDAAAGVHGQDEHAGEAHPESPWALVGRLFNFAILAGSLIYLLRSPFAAYLAARAKAIRADLAGAEEMRADAARQLAEIEQRMAALPAEIQALTERGKQEIAAEEARIREAAAAERQRMLEQARREIALQVRAAERMLRRRAGELAVDVAAERLRQTIGTTDHARLVDRYLNQVGAGNA
jgi:F-type H+-transporting ATPase subunit b